MGAYVLPVTESFVFDRCCTCNTPFYFPQSKFDRCKKYGESFYCPNGHSLQYAETENTKLKKDLEAEMQKLKFVRESLENVKNQRNRAERRVSAYKGMITKTKNRVGKGVCPCCNRFFSKLHDHMKNKHPEYSKEEVK